MIAGMIPSLGRIDVHAADRILDSANRAAVLVMSVGVVVVTMRHFWIP
jgi:hypothetical protein